MKSFRLRLLTLWYRLTGSTPTQAEWRARQAAGAPARARQAARVHLEQSADERFTCACGALLLRGQGPCAQCGRRPILPFALRRLARLLGLSDESPGRPGTLAVLATMLVGYAVQIRMGTGNFLDPSNGEELVDLGAGLGELTLGPQPWRALTYTMLHGGLMHLAFNGMALYQVGPLVEHRFGSSRFLFGWVVGGIGGGLASAAWSPLAPVVGASGSISGLIGMAMLQGHREGTSQGIYLRNEMIKWMIITTLLGLAIGGVSHAAHFGGLAGGVLVSLLLPPSDRHPTRRRMTPSIGLLAVALFVVALVGFGRWYFGRVVPEGAAVGTQARLYEITRRVKGEAVAFTPAGEALLRRVRNTRLDEAEQEAVVAEALALARDWPEVRRGLYFIHLQNALSGDEAEAGPNRAPPRLSPRAEELQEKPAPAER